MKSEKLCTQQPNVTENEKALLNSIEKMNLPLFLYPQKRSEPSYNHQIIETLSRLGLYSNNFKKSKNFNFIN